MVQYADMVEQYTPPEGMEIPPDFSLQERVLAYAMLHEIKDHVIRYTIDGPYRISKKAHDSEIAELVEKFRKDPKDCLAYARLNLFALQKDSKASRIEIQDRTSRYIDAFAKLQIKLDRMAFPPSKTIHKRVPKYIPDGLTDMGGDDELDPKLRGREKIRVDKRKIFEQAKKLLQEIYSMDISRLNLENPQDLAKLKKYIIERIAHFVYSEMPYDYKNMNPAPDPERSVGVDEFFKQRLAVCRHHALYTQVLMQMFGLTSRLLKCDLQFGSTNAGPHACNLVRINTEWHLLDVTNPDSDHGRGEIFMRPIPEKDIDLNTRTYRWELQRKQYGRKDIYTNTNNMHFRVNDNARNPLP